jgi:hypothetical protein
MPRRRSTTRVVTHRVVGGNVPLEIADRFYDTCDAMGTTQTAVLRDLIEGWLADHMDVLAGQESLPIEPSGGRRHDDLAHAS